MEDKSDKLFNFLEDLSKGTLDLNQTISLPARQDVIYESYGQLVKIILNDPRRLNTLALPMEIDVLVNKPFWNEKFKVCLLKGNGGNFCAGLNLKEYTSIDHTSAVYKLLCCYAHKFYLALRTMKPISIVFWEGTSMGAGLGISCYAKFRIATETTKFAMPEAKIGHFTDSCMALALSRARKNIGMMLAMTSSILKGKEVYQAGFAHYFVKQENLPALERAIERYAQSSFSISEHGIAGIISKFSEEIEANIEWEDLCDRVFSAETVVDMIARAKKEQNSHPIVKNWIASMEYNSPYSMWLSQQLIIRSKRYSLEEALTRELDIFRTEKHRTDDMIVGIQALFSKDKERPDWSIKLDDIKKINQEEVFADIPLFDFKKLPSDNIVTVPTAAERAAKHQLKPKL